MFMPGDHAGVLPVRGVHVIGIKVMSRSKEKPFFTKEEKKDLKKSPYIVRISRGKLADRITYTDRFKQYFVERYNNGGKPNEIFEEAGLPSKLIGPRRIELCSRRWRAKYGKKRNDDN